MKSQKHSLINCKAYISAFILFAIVGLFKPQQAYSQVDYTYGLNNKGFRLSAGYNLTILQTHFSENTLIGGFVGNLDYDINPYFSIGGEGQVGTLQGIDKVQHLQYSSSTDDFLTANLNFKVALGLIDDFESSNAFQDAVKKLYIGAGYGIIKYDLSLTSYTSQGTSTLSDHAFVIPLNLGTNIDLRGFLGNDKFSINPNYQFNIVNSKNFDGVPASAYSDSQNHGFYSAFSVKLKYKF